MKAIYTVLLVAGLVWAGCGKSDPKAGGSAQKSLTTEEVLRGMQKNCKAELDKINSYALVLEEDATLYAQKMTAAGTQTSRLEYRLAQRTAGREVPVGDKNIYEMFDRASCAAMTDSTIKNLAKRVQLKGVQKVDGSDAYVLSMQPTDLGKLGSLSFENMPKTAKISNVEVAIDASRFMLRQIKSQITEKIKNQDRTATVTSSWRNYKDIKGIQIPFETILLMEGTGIGLTDAEKAQIKAEIDRNKQMLSQIPDKTQQEQMRKMLERNEQQLAKTTADRVEQGLKLTGAKVNETIPMGIF